MILNNQIIKLKVDFETSRMFVLMQSFRNVPDRKNIILAGLVDRQ